MDVQILGQVWYGLMVSEYIRVSLLKGKVNPGNECMNIFLRSLLSVLVIASLKFGLLYFSLFGALFQQ